MSGPLAVLMSIWLLVIGYGLVYIGYQYFAKGQNVSFQDAFFPKGLLTAPTSSGAQGQGGPAAGNQNFNPVAGRSSGTQAFA